MIKNIVLILIFLNIISPCQAFMEQIDLIEQQASIYPEEQKKKIDVETVFSPLEYNDKEIKYIKKSSKLFKPELNSDTAQYLADFGFNKFSLGTGVVNVTYQVRKGVKYALKDTLAGYPEYQRRKQVEEILNSNINAHRLATRFLVGKKEIAPQLLEVAFEISRGPLIKELHGLFARIAFILLVLLTSLTIFRRMTENSFSFSHICAEPLMNGIFSAGLISFSYWFLKWCIKAVIEIQGIALAFVNEYFDGISKTQTLAQSWEAFVNRIGYMPSQVLSYIDILAQCFVYFFVAGLVLHIVIGLIISPIWGLVFVSDSLRSSAYNSLINWIKTLAVLAFIPIIYCIIKLISQEFHSYDYEFLEIIISIASYIYLPAISNIILAKSSGIFQPAFNGYQIIADSINNSYNGLKNSIENINKA